MRLLQYLRRRWWKKHSQLNVKDPYYSFAYVCRYCLKTWRAADGMCVHCGSTERGCR